MTVTNNGRRDARDRADELRRDRARAARRRPGASGVRQSLRRDRVARVVYRRSPPRAGRARRASRRAVVRARRGHRQGTGRAGDAARPTGRDSSAAAARPATRWRSSHDGALVGHDRRRARSDLRAPRAGATRAGQSASVAFTTLVATTRERAFELAGRYHDPHAAQRALDLAWTATQVELRELGITPADAAVFQELAGHLFYSRSRAARAAGRAAAQPRLAASGSGRTASRATGRSCSRRSTRPRACRPCGSCSRRTATGAAAGMTVDLVVLNAQPHELSQELHDQIIAAVYSRRATPALARPAGRRVRSAHATCSGADELLMLRATARVHVPCDGRSLGADPRSSASRERAGEDEPSCREPIAPSTPRAERRWSAPRSAQRDRRCRPAASAGAHGLERAAASRAGRSAAFDNGFGGLTADGRLPDPRAGDDVPPAPWANVIANPTRRLHRHRARRRIHLGGEQLLLPADRRGTTIR